jgi:ABC-type lipoprotein release transport system permease subunit
MAALWMSFRAHLRARWRATLALALLLGVMAGAATAAAVGARRTETAYPRFAQRYHAFDLSISTGGDPRTDQIFERISKMPLVRAADRVSLFFGTVRTSLGKEVAFPDVFLYAGPAGERGYKIVSGHDLDPRVENETVPNYAMAERLNVHPGDVVTITLTPQSEEPLPPSGQLRVRVVGVSAQVGGFESATGSGFPTTFRMTPAFNKRWMRYGSRGEDLLGVLLRNGEADADAFERELKRENIQTDGPPNRASSFTKGVQDLNRVPAIALWLLCGVLALTTLAVFTQLIGRELQLSSREHPALRALGSSRRDLIALGLIHVGAIAAVGAFASIVVAILLSPLTPVGLARIAEPDPGLTVAPSLVTAGASVTFILVLLAGVRPAWVAARGASVPAGSAGERGSSLADALARVGFPASMQSGVRLAIGPGRGERAVPVRTAALGMTIAIAALAAALGFAHSLDKLVATPRLAGYSWDAGVITNAIGPEDLGEKLPRLEASIRRAMPDVMIWRGTVFSTAAVGGLEISATVSDGPGPSVIDGRAPRGDSEVALDRRTLRRLRKRIGDTIMVANVFGPGRHGPPRRMTIVGTFAVPRFAIQGSLPGHGVAFTPDAAAALNPGQPYAEAVYVRFPSGADFDRQLSTLRAATAEEAFALVSRTQSPTVGNVERMSSLPLVLAVIVGLLGTATLAHALTTTIRRRRRDVAILKTLGFVRRQVRGAVAWQCTTLIFIALAIGVPAGVIAGRWGWRLFAAQLQVVPAPGTSLLATMGVVAGTLLLGNLIALGPGLAAARTPAAVVLRTE